MWPKSFTPRKMQSCTHSKAYMRRSSVNQTWYKPNSPAWVISQIYALSSIASLPPIIKCALNFCGLVWSHSLAAGYIKMILYLIRLGAKSPTVITLFLSRNQPHTYTEGIQSIATRRLRRHRSGSSFQGRGNTPTHTCISDLSSPELRDNNVLSSSSFSATPGLGKESSL